MSDTAIHFATVTPSDTADIGQCDAIFVGTGGNLACWNANGSSVTFTNVQNGQLLPIKTTRVLSTGTTASGIIALYD